MSGFTKLHSSITESSLWSESKDVRILWVAMLAKADPTGFVEAAVPGLARLANLTLPETEAALGVLMAPDPYSKNQQNEGRRVERVGGGYRITSYLEYRERRDDEKRRGYMREYMRERRAGTDQSVNSDCLHVNSDCLHVNSDCLHVNRRKHLLTPVNSCKPQLAQAEAEAEAEADKDVGHEASSECTAGAVPTSQKAESAQKMKKPSLCDSEYLAQLQSLPAYTDLNVDQEHSKMVSWCWVNGKQPTRRRLVNWLNRCDRPMEAAAPELKQAPAQKSVWTLKQQLEAVQSQIKGIEANHAIATPHGLQWDFSATEEIQKQYEDLRQKRKQLKQQIAEA